MSLNNISIVVPDPLLSIEVLNSESINESFFAATVSTLLENHTFEFVKFVSWKFSSEPEFVLVVRFTIEETVFGSQNDTS